MIDFLLLEWLDKSGISAFLVSSELFLLLFAAVVTIGVLGEATRATFWRPWHHAFEVVVFIGVAGEMIADTGVFISSARLQEINDHEIADARTKAGDAIERAATLERDSANLRYRAEQLELESATLKRENLELERTIGPRIIDQGALLEAMSVAPRVPIFIKSDGGDEPTQVADWILWVFRSLTPPWRATLLPPDREVRFATYNDGITILYKNQLGNSTATIDIPEKTAEILCRAIGGQRIESAFRPARDNREWVPGTPADALLILIGQKPNRFWMNKLLRQRGFREEPLPDNFCK